MKYLKILFSVFCVCCVMAAFWISAFADDLYPENTAPSDDNSYYQTMLDSSPATQPATEFIQDDFSPATQPATEFIQDDFSPATQPATEFIQNNYKSDPVIVDTVAPITPSNTNGFQSVVLGLLGNYSPVVIEYAYTNSNGFVSYLREVQPDYSWMASALIFLVVIYSLFRLIGALIKR